MSNTPQNAPGQEWSASGYAQNANFVSKLGSEVVKLLAPQPGERILDLGCGDGRPTTMAVDRFCQNSGLRMSGE